MFSPYYAWARRRGAADPLRHCAMNAVLYGPGRKRWAMTERTGAARGASWLRIGPSSLEWDGDTLTARLDEVTVPVPSRLRGTVRLRPSALTGRTVALDSAGRHLWSPLAPCARVEVEMQRPGLRWSGPGYFDTNAGAAPLEDDFVHWDWCRAPLGHGTAVLYNVTRRGGDASAIALHADPSGVVRDVPAPPGLRLPRTRWGMERPTRAESASVVRTLEDAPFYARSVLHTGLLGERATAVHESLSLDRFRAPWVQAMLPFRMPRKPG